MKKFRFRYLFFHLLLVPVCVYSQNNEATVTIIGNPLDNNIGNQFQNVSQNNIQNSQPPPPAQQEFAPTVDNIEPTLENGFHMRFQLESPASVERINSVSFSASSASSSGSSGGSSGGAKARKKAISMTERSFNFKKKFKNWLPKRKKKYHPTLCEKFR